MTIDNNKVLNSLRQVIDPDSGNDIVSMKLIENFRIKEDNISFSINTAGLDEANKFKLHDKVSTAVLTLYPSAKLDIHFLNKDKAGGLNHIKNIIAVASGKGGVGKSTVATNLALGIHKLGGRVGIIDADLYGPSIPTMLGLTGQKPVIKEVYGRHRIMPLEAYDIPAISIGNIVEPEQAVVLRGPRLGGIIKQFINEVVWPELDYLIIDLPPGTGDIQLTLVQTIPVTGAVIVTTPQEVAVADAVKAMNMFGLDNIKVPILGVVENMSWFTPDDMPNKKYKIFGEGGGKKLAKLSKSALLGQLPLITDIRKAADSGVPIVTQDGHPAQKHYMDICKNVLRQLAVRNEMLPPTKIVGMNTPTH